MAKLKRTSTGPTKHSTGSKIKVGNSDIGTEGNVGGNRSSTGGGYPWLPDKYEGANIPKEVSPGAKEGTSKSPIPWLPEKPEN